MAENLPPALQLHRDLELFRETINFTAAQTGFAERLVEKDYYCTVLLSHLCKADPSLVFKGGTCLAKVHSGFYRLSEDLDFTIPVAVAATRAERRWRAQSAKRAVAAVAGSIPELIVAEQLRGANNSTQYNGVIRYRSTVSGQDETIKVETSLREPLLSGNEIYPVATLLFDPLTSKPAIPPLMIGCISFIEAISEKFRAAITRREVAIRDFFDLDYAASKRSFDPSDPALVALVKAKLATPGNEIPTAGENRLSQLRLQLSGRLRPVLRQVDLDQFDLHRSYSIVEEMIRRLEE